MDALMAYGNPLGLAFQLRDDLLGTFGDTGKLGKPVGADLRAGKRTALIAEAERLLSPPARAVLDAVIGRSDASDDEVSRATELLVSCGAKKAVEEKLDGYVSRAMDALETTELRPEGVQMLRDLSELMTQRSH
jgi:geranylgeranyl diphosphate synthase type I